MVLKGAYKLSATAKLAPTLTEVSVHTILLEISHAMKFLKFEISTC